MRWNWQICPVDNNKLAGDVYKISVLALIYDILLFKKVKTLPVPESLGHLLRKVS